MSPHEWVIGGAAALAALLYIGKKLRAFFKALEVVADLIKHELTPNGGESIHDRVRKTHAMLEGHLEESAKSDARLAVVERRLGIGG